MRSDAAAPIARRDAATTDAAVTIDRDATEETVSDVMAAPDVREASARKAAVAAVQEGAKARRADAVDVQEDASRARNQSPQTSMPSSITIILHERRRLHRHRHRRRRLRRPRLLLHRWRSKDVTDSSHRSAPFSAHLACAAFDLYCSTSTHYSNSYF